MTDEEKSKIASNRGWLIAPLLSACVLGGIVVEARAKRGLAADADAYHARVRSAAASTPFRVGSWFGQDVPVPPAAVAMLHPNVILSRRYQEVASGRTVTFLLVQCSDARDILGHYPPVCYKTHGWTPGSAVRCDWQIDDLPVRAMEYGFSRSKLDQEAHITIENLMVLPNGEIARDMEGVDRIARDRKLRYFGAAQMQLVCPVEMTAAEREDLLRQFVRSNRLLIDAIRRGDNP